MSLFGTNRANRADLEMSVVRGRPEVAGRGSNRRDWPICMVRPCVASGFRRVGGERSCINVFGLWLELLCSWPWWISARVRSHY